MKKYSLMVEEEYARSLRGQIYKILPLYEEHAVDGYKHVESTILEIRGAEKEFREFDGTIEFFRILLTLKSLEPILEHPSKNYEQEHALVRREVFKCTNLLSHVAKLDGD